MFPASTWEKKVKDDPENQQKASNVLENFKKIFGSKIAMVFYLLCVICFFFTRTKIKIHLFSVFL